MLAVKWQVAVKPDSPEAVAEKVKASIRAKVIGDNRKTPRRSCPAVPSHINKRPRR